MTRKKAARERYLGRQKAAKVRRLKERSLRRPLEGFTLKIERANQHIDSLDERLDAFLQGNPYRVSADLDKESGKHVLHAHVVNDPPPEWSAIIGDVAHNLRSALDLLTWQLALEGTPSPPRSNAFPICLSRADYEDWGRTRIAKLPKAFRAEIACLQPYCGGQPRSDPLWLLSEINNMDKHRIIQTVGCTGQFNGLGINELHGFDILDLNVYGSTQIERISRGFQADPDRP